MLKKANGEYIMGVLFQRGKAKKKREIAVYPSHFIIVHYSKLNLKYL